MTRHTHTVSTRGLQAGDLIYGCGRTVSRTERSMTSLNAWVVYYTDGTHDYAGTCDAWMIERN